MQQITEREFEISLNNKNGNFKNKIFNFKIDISNFKKIDFSLNFENSIFSENVNFSKTIFNNEINISKAVFLKNVNFSKSNFSKNFTAYKTEFYQFVYFNHSSFLSNTDFNKAIFHNNVTFRKTQFLKNLFFNKTFFYKKIDFSYASFSDSHLTSFISINQKFNKEKIHPPFFIFRYIYFSDKITFTNTDISKTIFQDSNILSIIFKDCTFPKKNKRNALYSEISKTGKLKIKESIKDLSTGTVNTILVPFSKELNDLNIGDKLEISNEKNKDLFFIINRFDSSNKKDFKIIDQVNSINSVSHFNNLSCKDCTIINETKNIAFQIKKFNYRKHWEILEDNYRQLKTASEQANNWEAANEFYRAEMSAQIKKLAFNKEKKFYRSGLFVYKAISCFGSSIVRIWITIFISLLLGMVLLSLIKPELSFFELAEKNIMFFLPIFGETADQLKNLQLQSWQNLIILIEITWFYLLWLILAITIQRRFKR